jgi:hypothetical protein
VDFARFRILHAAPHAPPLDPYLLPVGAPLDTLPTLQPFVYGSLALTADLIRWPGRWIVEFTEAGTTRIVLTSGEIDASSGGLVTVVLGDVTNLFFRYQLTGADTLKIALVNRTAKESQIVELKGLAKDKWADALIDFSDAKPQKPKAGDKVDEIHFLLPKGADLLIDDLLLYEPG